jgi:hypothetical protein
VLDDDRGVIPVAAEEALAVIRVLHDPSLEVLVNGCLEAAVLEQVLRPGPAPARGRV